MNTSFLDQRWPWLLAAALILLAFLVSVLQVGGGGDPRPTGSVEDVTSLVEREDLNILFILVDTLRADHLGSYGYGRDTSPTLDRLAATGIRFSRHLAQSSWTKSSMASLWTGMVPARHGIKRFDDVIPEEAVLAAELLRDGGFNTVGIFRNGWVAPTFGFEQGFEVYTKPMPKPLPPEVRAKNPTLKELGTDEQVITAAAEFLRIHGDKRWFLYLHMMDIHEYVYDEASAKFGGTYVDNYDSSILWLDGTIEVLMEYLVEEGYTENTLIVIASDHGEAFNERGLEGHARHVYKESTEVPLILSFPFRIEPGVVVDSRTRNIDILPTILDLVGLGPMPDADGVSLVPEIVASMRGEALPADDRVGISFLDQTWGKREEPPQPSVAVTQGPWRYVRGVAVEQLFDASSDAAEVADLTRRDPEALERLRGIADEYLEIEPAYEAPTREINEMELNQLRALGYAIP